MADAISMTKRYQKEFPDANVENILHICILAESVNLYRDGICQSIDALTRAIKESGQ